MSKPFFANFLHDFIDAHGILFCILAFLVLSMSMLAVLTVSFGMGPAWLLYLVALLNSLLLLTHLHKSPLLPVYYSLPIARWSIECAVLTIALLPAFLTILFFVIAGPFALKPISIPTLVVVQATIAGVPALCFILVRRTSYAWLRIRSLPFYGEPLFILVLGAAVLALAASAYLRGRGTINAIGLGIFLLYIALEFRRARGTRKRVRAPQLILLKCVARHYSTMGDRLLLNYTLFWVSSLALMACEKRAGLFLTCLAVYFFFNHVAAYLREMSNTLRVRATLPVPVEKLPINGLLPILIPVVLLALVCTWTFEEYGNVPAPWTLAAFAVLAALIVLGTCATILGWADEFVVAFVLGVIITALMTVVVIAYWLDMGMEQKALADVQGIAIGIIVVALVSIPIQIRIFSRTLRKHRIDHVPRVMPWRAWEDASPL